MTQYASSAAGDPVERTASSRPSSSPRVLHSLLPVVHRSRPFNYVFLRWIPIIFLLEWTCRAGVWPISSMLQPADGFLYCFRKSVDFCRTGFGTTFKLPTFQCERGRRRCPSVKIRQNPDTLTDRQTRSSRVRCGGTRLGSPLRGQLRLEIIPS